MSTRTSWPQRAALLLAVIAGGWLIAAPAQASPRAKAPSAAPRSIDDCERYKEPLAYNACLASFGPARAGGGAMVTPEVANDGEQRVGAGADRAESRYRSRDRRYSRSYRSRRHNGRASASFSVPDSIINPGRRNR